MSGEKSFGDQNPGVERSQVAEENQVVEENQVIDPAEMPDPNKTLAEQVSQNEVEMYNRK